MKRLLVIVLLMEMAPAFAIFPGRILVCRPEKLNGAKPIYEVFAEGNGRYYIADSLHIDEKGGLFLKKSYGPSEVAYLAEPPRVVGGEIEIRESNSRGQVSIFKERGRWIIDLSLGTLVARNIAGYSCERPFPGLLLEGPSPLPHGTFSARNVRLILEASAKPTLILDRDPVSPGEKLSFVFEHVPVWSEGKGAYEVDGYFVFAREARLGFSVCRYAVSLLLRPSREGNNVQALLALPRHYGPDAYGNCHQTGNVTTRFAFIRGPR